MRATCLIAAVAAVMVAGGCNREQSRERSDAAARQAGRTAYQLDHDGKKAARQLGHDAQQAGRELQQGLDRASHNVRQGWNEAKHQEDTRRK